MDSLYSIVQMPGGVPVATVAIGNATNAGLLAVRMLGATRPELRENPNWFLFRHRGALWLSSFSYRLGVNY